MIQPSVPTGIFVIWGLITTHLTYAQQEASRWYFGNKAAVTFGPCQLQTATVGTQLANEGVAVMSDAQGRLRFYTNGITFWNDQHQVMPQGEVTPHWSINNSYDYTTTTQAALIVPQVGQIDRYWTFLTSPRATDISDGRFCYVSVGPTGPNGSLAVEHPPVCLADTLTERMTGIQHSNGEDYWVIVQSYQSGDILSFLVNRDGVNATPVVSRTGRQFRQVLSAENNTSYMKVSPDGTKLAYVYWEATDDTKTAFDNVIAVLDYDAASGQASNPSFIDRRLVDESYYGLEFSPDGSKLYVCSTKNLLQYDLSQPAWAASQKVLYHFGNFSHSAEGRHALQLAPDGRIYLTNNGHLGAILNPNLSGEQATAVPYFTEIQGAGAALVGLPNVVQSYLRNPSQVTCPARLHTFRSCILDSTYVSLLVDQPETVASVRWRGLPESVSRGFVLTTPYDPSVPFTAEAFVTFTNGQDTTLSVVVNEVAAYRLPQDTTLCAGDTLWVVPPADTTYRWGYDRLRPEEVENEAGLIPITENGSYSIYLDVESCANSDNMYVQIEEPLPSFDLGEDQTACQRGYTSVSLSSNLYVDSYTYGEVSYLWSDGSTNRRIEVRESGTYWLRIENRCGVQTDTVRIVFDGELTPNLGQDQVLCHGEQIILDPKVAGAVLWSTGSTEPTLTVTEPGTYEVRVTNSCGEYTDAVTIRAALDVPLALPDTVYTCASEPVTLLVDHRYAAYQWSTGEQDSVIQVNQTGYYEVVVENYCRVQRAGTWVEVRTPEVGFIPTIITPNGDGLNDTFWLDEHLLGSHLHIYNRWGREVYQQTRYQNEWDGQGLAAGVYLYTIDHPCLPEPLRGYVTVQREQGR